MLYLLTGIHAANQRSVYGCFLSIKANIVVKNNYVRQWEILAGERSYYSDRNIDRLHV
jgi:hypothetical protein